MAGTCPASSCAIFRSMSLWSDGGCFSNCCGSDSTKIYMDGVGKCECPCAQFKTRPQCGDWWNMTWCLRTWVRGFGVYKKLGGTILLASAYTECEYEKCINFSSGREVGGGRFNYPASAFPTSIHLRRIYALSEINNYCPCWRSFGINVVK